MTHIKGLCNHVLAALILLMPAHASGLSFELRYIVESNNDEQFTAKVKITSADPIDQQQEPSSSSAPSTGTIHITTILTTESGQSTTASRPVENELLQTHYSLQPLTREQRQNSVATHALLNHDGELIQQVALDPSTLQLLEGTETPLALTQSQQSITAGSQPFFLAFLPALPGPNLQIDYPIYQTPEPSGSGNEEPPIELALQTFPDGKETAIIRYEEFSDQQLLITEVTHIETSTSQFQFAITLTGWNEFTIEALDTETSESTPEDIQYASSDSQSQYASSDSQSQYASSDSQSSLTSFSSTFGSIQLLVSVGILLTKFQLNPVIKKPSDSFSRDRSSSF